MSVTLHIRNQGVGRLPLQRAALQQLADRICAGEGLEGDPEISVLFCDDAFIAELNGQYRNKPEATDVLSFPQEAPQIPGASEVVLGDVVVSMDTVRMRCHDDRSAMREEILLLFCHGVLHLLGYEHDTAEAAEEMNRRQARYLGLDQEAAWRPERIDKNRR